MDYEDIHSDLMCMMKDAMDSRERAEAIFKSKMCMLSAVLVGDLTGREAEIEKARQEALDAMSAVLDITIDAHKRVDAYRPK